MFSSDEHASARIAVLERHLKGSDTQKALDLSSASPGAFLQSCRNEVDNPESKVVSASQAVAFVRDGATITIGGFVGCGCPEAIIKALKQRYVSTRRPQNLHLFVVCVTGDKKGRGVNELAIEGLISKFSFGWTGNCPDFVQLIRNNKIQAWNLPLGVVSHMIRDAAAKRPGPATKIGLGTFVDPREGGGKLNSISNTDVVKLLTVDGEEYLHYRAPRIDVAVVRGTTADTAGNVSFEKECFYADTLNQAIAAHNNGGLVIAQVERMVATNSIPSRMVHLPAALVDKVVVSPPEHHWQSLGFQGYSGELSGELRAPLSSLQPLPLDARKVIAHRCMLAFDRPHSVVNLGVGMPEGVAVMVSSHAERDCPNALPITLSTEVGVMGGFPSGGQSFGAAVNADSLMTTSTMIDMIQGGGLDVAVLGCAEVDEAGNVNVSQFSGRHPGCGGFIDISQSAKQVIFAGTFTSCGLKVEVREGRLSILAEGKTHKFRRKVQEKTFAGTSCRGRPVLYVTERCVFKLLETQEGPRVELTEIAPGVRLEDDVLRHMDFRPVIRDVKLMDKRCFKS